MRLTILSVGYPLATAGSDAVGGAEQILTLLDRAISRAGHTSIVVAPAGSTISGLLVPINPARPPFDASAQARVQQETRRAVREAIQTHGVDLIHMHGLDFAEYLPPPGPPVLATLHLPPFQYAPKVWRLRRPLTFLHGVSNSQHASLPKPRVRLLDPIPNGVPVDELHPAPSKNDFVLALGRICAAKGYHLAAEAARQAGVRLVLAGTVFPYPDHQHYFETILQPLISQGVIEFVGAVGLEQKRDLLARARCLLVPSQTTETSSLVAMEAAACGTPVIAFRAGALVEIIENGRTGILVDSVREMADAIRRLDQIDPGECRRVAEARFSAAKMSERYLERYEQLVRPRRVSLPAVTVDAVTSVSQLELLTDEWADLWQRTQAPSVFQHPDWLIPWCRPFGVNQPWVILVRRGTRLVGVAPFVVYERGAARVLTLLGAGVSDDQGVVAEAGQESLVMEAVWQYLAEHADAFDVCELENLPQNSFLLGPTPSTWQATTTSRQDVRVVLRVPTGSRLDDVLPGVMRKRLRYAENRALRELLPPRAKAVDTQTFDELFDGLVRLHRARWVARGEPGMLPPHLVDFHREAARRLLRRGILRLHGLYLGDRLAAVFYGYHAADRTIYYLSGFDPELERFSPGNLVVARAIDYAIRIDNARYFDFLRGAESYKYAWGATDEALFSRSLQVPTREVADAA